MDENEVWYFAYGSNLNKNQMRERIGEWRASERAVVKEHKLVFNVKSSRWGGLAANLIKTQNAKDRVYGAVYRIQKEQLDKMTQFESTSPRDISVESGLVEMLAKIYIFKTIRESGKPPSHYLKTILDGLKQHGYSKKIIEKVKNAAIST